MKLTQRTLIIGAVVVAVLVVLALQVIDPVFVVLVLAVLALVGLVAWGRVRSRERADEEADWASGGDEWGLASDQDDDDYVDVDDRLAGFGGPAQDTMPSRRGLFAEDQFEEEEDVAWQDDRPAGVASYADDTFEEEFEGLVEEYGTAEEAVEYDEVVEEYEEYDEPEPEPARRTASIFAAPGVIDEEALDSDDAILAASEATRLQYDDVLTREDANAETREILNRVASLLAKYE